MVLPAVAVEVDAEPHAAAKTAKVVISTKAIT
jgi:hypothetical protein